MKHLLLLIALSCCFSCARPTATPSINIISREAQGLLHLECDGKGNNRPVAETDAKVSVLNRLLYDGIPDAGVSAVRLPMVEDGSKLSSQQRSEVNKLLQGDALNRYFTEVAWVSQSSTAAVGGGALQRFRLKVNYDLFRRDLESHGIVRKFGM